ncbi:hypothetical protein [Agrococcus sp. KRD186]|jgi:hypothetical protein|uniref:hypothetical protein n=1 Tax=Agrococcus sp. KRD186 TaxID=2729730 RepID=UPI0019D2B758|nr:hypothetical protein [Agrococcus sp. KRD186]
MSEIRRELRWAWNSKLILVLLLAAAAATGWNTVSNSSFASAEVGQFLATVEEYEQAGESVEAALQAPVSIETGPGGAEITNNPLRYDYDRASVALGNMSALGSARSAIALSTVLFFPVLGMLLGVGLATHDARSRSIRVRWPQSGLVAFVAAKTMTLLLLVFLTCLATLAASSAAGAIATLLVPGVAGDSGVTAATPRIDGGILLSIAYSLGVGGVFGLAAFAIASWARERAFTMSGLVLAYFLIPILGPLDPRNLILVVGRDILEFTGSFRPMAILGPSPMLGLAIGGLLCAVAMAASITAWLQRARY